MQCLPSPYGFFLLLGSQQHLIKFELGSNIIRLEDKMIQFFMSVVTRDHFKFGISPQHGAESKKSGEHVEYKEKYLDNWCRWNDR